MKYLSLFFLNLLLSCSSGSQDLNLPTSENARLGNKSGFYIPIVIIYDSANELLLDLDGKITSDINDLEPYLLASLKSVSPIKFHRTHIQIIADKELRMYDFEWIQEELKRLGLQKMFYVTAAGKGSWSTGIHYKLPLRDEERISSFYQQRNLAVKESVNLRHKAFSENRQNENIAFEGMPPPPPPPPSFPTRFDEENPDDAFHNLKVAIISIDQSDYFSFNKEEIATKHLKSKMMEELADEPCAFVLRKDPKATYAAYIEFLGILFDVYAEKRNEVALKKYSMKYAELQAGAKREIRSKVPYIFIEESIYMQ